VEAKYDSLSGRWCSKEVAGLFVVGVEKYSEGVGCFLEIY
jgi:hypothetical protein